MKVTKRHGSKHLQARGCGVRFVYPVLDCKVCPECKRIVIPWIEGAMKIYECEEHGEVS